MYNCTWNPLLRTIWGWPSICIILPRIPLFAAYIFLFVNFLFLFLSFDLDWQAKERKSEQASISESFFNKRSNLWHNVRTYDWMRPIHLSMKWQQKNDCNYRFRPDQRIPTFFDTGNTTVWPSSAPTIWVQIPPRSFAFFVKCCWEAVWQDVEIKRNPNFTICSRKSCNSSFFLKGMFSKVAQKVNIYLGSFSEKMFDLKLSKIAQSGLTVGKN